MRKTYLAAALIALISTITGIAVGIAGAQDGGDRTVTDDDVNRVARQLYCPICENVPLDVCGTRACIDARNEIRQMLEDGMSDEEIIAVFVERWGERAVATPRDPTLSFLVWALPLTAIVIAVALLVWQLYSWSERRTRPAQQAPAIQPGTDDKYRQRLEREIRERS